MTVKLEACCRNQDLYEGMIGSWPFTGVYCANCNTFRIKYGFIEWIWVNLFSLFWDGTILVNENKHLTSKSGEVESK